MADSVNFTGANQRFDPQVYCPDDGTDTGMRPIFAYVSPCDTMVYSAWRLSEDELQEVKRSGLVFLAHRQVGRPIMPTWVGSRSFIRRNCRDHSRLWQSHEVSEFPPTPPRKLVVEFDFRGLLPDQK